MVTAIILTTLVTSQICLKTFMSYDIYQNISVVDKLFGSKVKLNNFGSTYDEDDSISWK
jgi:hypothetical protein